MTETPGGPASSHPVAAFAARAEDRSKALNDAPVWSMTERELRDTLVHLAQVEAQPTALRSGVLAEADRRDACADDGSPSAADWVATKGRHTRTSARSDLQLARRLEQLPSLERGCKTGGVNVEQAKVIAAAIDRLPTTGEFAVSAEQRDHAEAHLVDLASDHDAKALARLGRRIFEVINPDLADELEGKLLEAQEARARRNTRLTLFDDSEGMTHIRGCISALHGAMLKKALWALTDPAAEGPKEVERGRAFCDLLERLPRSGISK